MLVIQTRIPNETERRLVTYPASTHISTLQRHLVHGWKSEFKRKAYPGSQIWDSPTRNNKLLHHHPTVGLTRSERVRLSCLQSSRYKKPVAGATEKTLIWFTLKSQMPPVQWKLFRALFPSDLNSETSFQPVFYHHINNFCNEPDQMFWWSLAPYSTQLAKHCPQRSWPPQRPVTNPVLEPLKCFCTLTDICLGKAAPDGQAPPRHPSPGSGSSIDGYWGRLFISCLLSTHNWHH